MFHFSSSYGLDKSKHLFAVTDPMKGQPAEGVTLNVPAASSAESLVESPYALYFFFQNKDAALATALSYCLGSCSIFEYHLP